MQLSLVIMILSTHIVLSSSLNVCGLNATLGNSVMSVLNFTYPGLEAVAAAWRS